MEFTHAELADSVKRLLVLSAEQRANINALTSGVAQIVTKLASDEARAREIIQEFADYIDARKPEMLEELLIEMEDQHPAFAADLSEISTEMQESRRNRESK